MNKPPLHVNCPTCGKTILWSEDQPWRPFCSERCKLIDLGEWAEGTHRIPGKPCYDEPGDGGEDQEP